ncbi:MAG: Hsp20/alpha crystallin family protein [Chromatiales bacterium]|jgi:HSP20 family protein
MAKKDITGSKIEGKPVKKSGHLHAMTPFEEMERMFGEMFPRRVRPFDWEWPAFPEMAWGKEMKMPRMDIVEHDEDVVVRAELPGVDKKDIDVSVTDSTVTIKGHTRKESKEEKGEYFRSEITRGEFYRTATLPCEVDGDRAKASFADGMLELSIPKMEGAKRHSIKVE